MNMLEAVPYSFLTSLSGSLLYFFPEDSTQLCPNVCQYTFRLKPLFLCFNLILEVHYIRTL